MYDALIIAAFAVFVAALVAELRLTAEDARTTPPKQLAAILAGIAVSAALVATAELALPDSRSAGSEAGLLAKGVGLAAEYLPHLLYVSTALVCVDVIRTWHARRRADGHIATPGRPKLPGA
ncbi:hypothetical protein H181DRAFT_02578 [Streptomyces sp. WMMB 714]|uniref:hypothetical protein n=1 Tax=Streptomyces sp. WMMB 714 TaxID=1286822 RepID=UPI0005F7E65C|nr:hypothetical protein [Streptomyces sp. WMMB 714]SCK32215.1 hypothetical protein H181DRAFT_02578 [Streptomyces sp. WMMB 714]